MPKNDLIDSMVTNSFTLELDGKPIALLSGVSGLDIELEAKEFQQVNAKGMAGIVKYVGNYNKAPDLQLTRIAPVDSTTDGIWKWFNDIRDKGMSQTDPHALRKNGSVVMFDHTFKEIGRFNFFNAWPSKIATDGLSVDSGEPIKETITLVCERLERVK